MKYKLNGLYVIFLSHIQPYFSHMKLLSHASLSLKSLNTYLLYPILWQFCLCVLDACCLCSYLLWLHKYFNASNAHPFKSYHAIILQTSILKMGTAPFSPLPYIFLTNQNNSIVQIIELQLPSFFGNFDVRTAASNLPSSIISLSLRLKVLKNKTSICKFGL